MADKKPLDTIAAKPAGDEPKAEPTPSPQEPAPVEDKKTEETTAESETPNQAPEATEVTPETATANTEVKPEEKPESATPAPDNVEATPTAEAAASTPENTTPPVQEPIQPVTPTQFEQLFPEPQVVVSGPPAWVWWTLMAVGAAGVLFLSYDLVRRNIAPSSEPTPSAEATIEATATPESTQTPEQSPTAQASPSPTSSSTSSPSPSTAAGSLRILNGTTVTGLASSTRTALVNAGIAVRTIGNANNRNYTKTIVYYSGSGQALAQQVSQALSITEEPTLSTLANPDAVLVVVGTDRR